MFVGLLYEHGSREVSRMLALALRLASSPLQLECQRRLRQAISIWIEGPNIRLNWNGGVELAGDTLLMRLDRIDGKSGQRERNYKVMRMITEDAAGWSFQEETCQKGLHWEQEDHTRSCCLTSKQLGFYCAWSYSDLDKAVPKISRNTKSECSPT